MERRLRQSKAPPAQIAALGRLHVSAAEHAEHASACAPADFDILAARRDQLVGQLEALYRSVCREMEVQT